MTRTRGIHVQMSTAYGPIIAIVLIAFAVIVGGLGLLVMLGLAAYLLMGRGGEEEPKVEKKKKKKKKKAEAKPTAAPVGGPPPVPDAVAAAAAASKSDFADDPTSVQHATGGDGATEVFHKDVHSRLMGWDDDDEDEEENEAATQLFTKDQLQAQYADLMDEDD